MTNLSLALLGYDFLRKNKINILTTANCLLIQNVPIITYMHQSRITVEVLTANFIIEKYSENILEKQTEKQEDQQLSEDQCILEPEVSIEYRLWVLIARGFFNPASSMLIRLLNVSNRLVNLKTKMKVGDLLPIVTSEQQLCLTTITDKEKSNLFQKS